MTRPVTAARRPTMADVAELAGVSLKTVSRVINSVPTVDDTLAARVHEASAALGFQANLAASALRSGSSSATIGLLIKDLSNAFYATIASAVADVAKANHTQLITAHSGENADDELEAIFELCRRRVDGLLIVPTGGDHSALKPEIERGIPMVFLDRRPVGLVADSVVLDNFAGARDAATKLLNEGHERIAVIVDTLRMPTMRERLDGVASAFTAKGLALDDALVVTNVSSPEAASLAAERLIASIAPPTAFFCGNNRSGVGVLETLWKHGRREPLVSFDDFALSDLMPRPFTVVRYDNRAMGTIGAQLLFRRISREEFEPQTVVLPTELVDRGIADRATI
jgi:LacI family transcriptional regulator